MRHCFAFAGVALLLSAACASAQESRGSITGRVTDPQGALIPGAAVVITNVETNQVSRTTTNETGYFEVNLLNPGNYSASAEAPGFKKSIQTGVVLNVAGRVDINIQLQVGQLAETVEVTAVTPLLDTTTANGGRVIDNQQIMQLPFSDMNPFALSALSPGMQWTGQPEYRRPFDNGGTSAFNTMGGVGANEYTIDGAPVTGTNGRVGFVPPSDAVEEFKLETSTFDASYGHTSGATINVMTKSGTNLWHGSLYDQHWQQRWNATPHFTRISYNSQVAQGKIQPGAPKQAPGRSNNFGGTLGGPVKIPKLYDGKDKLFFFFSYNGIYQKKAETTSSINRDVPKMAWRQGDFSDMQALDAVKYTVYDPRTARMGADGHVQRLPFPGNKGVPILNPMYKYYVEFFPKPNDVPGLVSPEGDNNYYAANMPKDERFNSLVNRIDYNISDRHRVFGRWYWNHRLADEYDWTYETKRGLHANGLTRINKGGGGNYLWTISDRNILDVGVSLTRFNEGNERPIQTAYKPSDVGLPKYLDDRAGQWHTLPQVAVDDVEQVSGGYPVIGTRGTTGEAKAQMTSILGSHSFKYGFQERRYWATTASPGTASGSFSFGNSYMRAADNASTASSRGLSWAAFMMAMPTGISIAGNDSAVWSTRFRSIYFQDDWRATKKLRLSFGLRYEREGGTTERFNRAMTGGFDFNAKLPISDLVEAAYAKNPIPEMPASQFKIRGGALFMSDQYPTYTNGTHHFLPKAGAVYQLDGKTVIRGGYGWYYDTYNVSDSDYRPSQDGFSQSTSTSRTNDNGLTFCCGVGAVANLSAVNNPLIDPFPVRADGTRFNAPYRDRLGLMSRQGRGWDIQPRNFNPAWQQRWRIGIQREITRDVAIEVSYNGATSHYWVARDLSYVPEQYWAKGNTRNQAVEDFLNTNVANPFNIANLQPLAASDPFLYNWLSTQGFFTGKTVRRNLLLRPYPNLNGLTGVPPGQDISDSLGRNVYNDLQVQFEKRFSHSFQSSVMYTRAQDYVTDWYANPFDKEMSERMGNNVRPHRLVWSTIFELPFGKGRAFVNSGPAQHLLGGWSLNWIYQYQNGRAIGWGNRFFYGSLDDFSKLLNHDAVRSRDMHQWFDPSIAYTSGTGPIPANFHGFEGRTAFQPAGWQTRVFPSRMDNLREDGIRNWDVKVMRKFRIRERLNANFSVDMLNATNHTNFEGPNTDPTSKSFGRVTTQRGLSRVIQFNLRIDF
ncbi:MAG: carboxypeptidase regulatory-like domain-containing protein [Bryobacteraceae bacterium]